MRKVWFATIGEAFLSGAPSAERLETLLSWRVARELLLGADSNEC